MADKPLSLTDAELDELSVVTEDDEDAAVKRWDESVDELLIGLLLLSGFEWDAGTYRYYDEATGAVLSPAKIAAGLESLIEQTALNFSDLTQKLIDGKITLASWQSSMLSEIKISHTASAALANGGMANVAEWSSAERLIARQYDFLRGFADDIANGTQALDGRALVRADLYADAVNGTYWEEDKLLHLQDGYEEGRRVLEPGVDHCEDCEEYASEGWMPIEDIPEIGNSQCLTRCRCTIEYRTVQEQ